MWQDYEARAALLADPVTILREAGLHIPQGQSVTDRPGRHPTVRHVALPADLSDETLQRVLSLIARALPLPKEMQVVVRQSTEDERLVALPPALRENDSLSEDDLGLVVGGNGGNGGAGGVDGNGGLVGEVIDWIGGTVVTVVSAESGGSADHRRPGPPRARG